MHKFLGRAKFVNQIGQKSAFGRFLSCVGITHLQSQFINSRDLTFRNMNEESPTLTITLVFSFISTDTYQIQEMPISSFLLIILLSKISLSACWAFLDRRRNSGYHYILHFANSFESSKWKSWMPKLISDCILEALLCYM